MHYSKEEKAMWLEDWKASGKKPWIYAKENGLIPQTFVGWTKKMAQAVSGFVEIRPQVLPKMQGAMMLIEKGGARIHIPLDLSSDRLRMVLGALGVAL